MKIDNVTDENHMESVEERIAAEKRRHREQWAARATKLYHSGKSIEAVASLMSTSRQTLRRILDEYGVKLRPPAPRGRKKSALCVSQDDLLRAEVTRLYEQGLPVDEIASLVSRAPTSIFSMMKRWGVPRRPRGLSARLRAAKDERLRLVARDEKPIAGATGEVCRCGLRIDRDHTQETCDLESYRFGGRVQCKSSTEWT